VKYGGGATPSRGARRWFTLFSAADGIATRSAAVSLLRDGDWSRTLGAWIARDALLLALFGGVFRALRHWHAERPGAASAIGLAIGGFALAYSACYLAHEWGHLLGARALGADPPRGSIRGLAQPLFDPRAHSRAQFLGLAFGGLLGYLGAAAAIVAAFRPELGFRAAALGAGAFVVQSVAVDAATLLPVLCGADVSSASRAGTRPALILRRTGIAWGALAAALAGVHHLAGGLP
jgi:hypothetical protein